MQDDNGGAVQLQKHDDDAKLRYCSDERIDLPSLTSFRGGQYNLQNIGTITLESIDLEVD